MTEIPKRICSKPHAEGAPETSLDPETIFLAKGGNE